MLEFIKNNYTWFFSGIGTTIICSIISFFIGHKTGYNKAIKKNHLKANVKNNSTSYQAGGNITINGK